MEKEKLQLSKEDAQELISGGLEGFDIIQDKVTGNSRWSVFHRIVVKRLSDGKFFADTYSCGATEQQNESPYEFTEPEFVEVEKKEKITYVYE